MSLSRTIQSMIFRGAVKKLDDAADVQVVQTSGLGGYIDDAEHVQPYGFRSRPFAGAQTVVARLGALGALVAWIFDGRYKVALDEGEVAIFDDQGQKVHLKRAGIEVSVPTGKSVKILSGTVEIGNGADAEVVRWPELKTYLEGITYSVSGTCPLGGGPLELGTTIAAGEGAVSSDIASRTTKVK